MATAAACPLPPAAGALAAIGTHLRQAAPPRAAAGSASLRLAAGEVGVPGWGCAQAVSGLSKQVWQAARWIADCWQCGCRPPILGWEACCAMLLAPLASAQCHFGHPPVRPQTRARHVRHAHRKNSPSASRRCCSRSPVASRPADTAPQAHQPIPRVLLIVSCCLASVVSAPYASSRQWRTNLTNWSPLPRLDRSWTC